MFDDLSNKSIYLLKSNCLYILLSKIAMSFFLSKKSNIHLIFYKLCFFKKNATYNNIIKSFKFGTIKLREMHVIVLKLYMQPRFLVKKEKRNIGLMMLE